MAWQELLLALLALSALVAAGVGLARLVAIVGRLPAATGGGARHRLGGRLVDLLLPGRWWRPTGAGLMHLLLGWSAVVLLPRLVELSLRPGEPEAVTEAAFWGLGFVPVREVADLVLLLAVGYALLRRLVLKPRPLPLRLEAELVLVLLAAVAAGDLLHEAARFVTGGPHPELESTVLVGPLSELLVPLRLSRGSWLALREVALWMVLGGACALLALLPWTTLRHLLFGPLSVARARRERGVRLDREMAVGALACTRCGRCSMVCPVAQAGRALRPDLLIRWLQRELLGGGGRPPSEGARAEATARLELASCGGCGDCDRECPLRIGIVAVIEMVRGGGEAGASGGGMVGDGQAAAELGATESSR